MDRPPDSGQSPAGAARKMVRVVQFRSAIACQSRQRRVLAGIGLSRPGTSVLRQDTPSLRGMVAKIPHLVRIEEVVE